LRVTLNDLLALDAKDADRFVGASPDDGWRRVFGGLVVAQALMAASRTVEGRVCHSLHSYFLRPGDPAQPLSYAVERTRDGASFATRRVTASQGERAIFEMLASFQTPETGLEHQVPMPPAPPPESLREEALRWLEMGDALPAGARAFASGPQRIDVRWVQPRTISSTAEEPNKAVWMRAKEPVTGGEAQQQATLAYASDMTLVETAMRPHGLNFWSGGVQTASLDHALWFHHPIDFNQWHLYVQDSPASAGSRGLARGSLFRQDGLLVASAAQEGLMRLRP
jgi:acyl-CoA thioesterase-2